MGSLAKFLIAPLPTALGLFKKPKVTQPVAQPQITPRGNSVVADMLARRRGEGMNDRTGGAESQMTGKPKLLGSGG